MKSILLCSALVLLAPALYGQGQSAHAIRHREVAVTFDDLPATHNGMKQMTTITRNLLRTIQTHNIPAIGFVNEGKLHVRGELNARTSLLRQWVDAGLELGNHTFSHVWIDRVPLGAYKEEVIRGETVTKMLLRERQRQLRYFRHTQLRTGPTKKYKEALDAFLASRGYTVAPVTLDNNEYIFAAVYSRAKEKNDSTVLRQVAHEYIGYMEEVFEHFERLSVALLGYEVKQILLLHANELNADYFEDVVQMIKRRGYKFILLEEALKDPAYRLPDVQSKRGLSWIHRWKLARGEPMEPEPNVPADIAQLFRTYGQ
ncbi:MAG: polysaccharide deacetylase family protein [Bacteroidota bacterium]